MAAQTRNHDIARRYALAFYGLAKEQSSLDASIEDINKINDLIKNGGNALHSFLAHAALPRDQQAKAVLALAQYLNLSPLGAKFLGTLAQKRRLPALPAIVAALQGLVAADKGETTAEVTAAQPLTDAQVQDIAAHLQKMLGLKNVKVELAVDPALIGGLTIKVGSKLIDGSVRTKLDRLHRTLKNNNASSDKATMKEVA